MAYFYALFLKGGYYILNYKMSNYKLQNANYNLQITNYKFIG